MMNEQALVLYRAASRVLNHGELSTHPALPDKAKGFVALAEFIEKYGTPEFVQSEARKVLGIDD